MDKETKEIKLTKREQRIYDFMVKNGSITQLEAITEFGETRLSAIIYEFKKYGIPIGDEWEKVKNRYGENRHVKKYFIA